MNPAPADSRTSRIGTRKPLGRFFSPASWLSEYWRLGHADRQVAEAQVLVLLDRLARGRQQVDPVGAIDAGRDRLDLLGERDVVRVEELEVGLAARRRVPDRLRERRGTLAAVTKWRRDDRIACAGREGDLLDRLDLAGVSVGNELIATTAGTPNRRTFSICLARFCEPSRTASTFSSSSAGSSGLPATILPTPPCILSARTVATTTAASGRRPRRPALDVEELLGAHVGAEAGLGADDLVRGERDPIRDDRVVAVGDVRERSAMDERRTALEGLEEVRLQGVLEQDGHRARDAQVLGGDRLAVARRGHDHAAQAGAEVLENPSRGRGRPSPRSRR